ncbi:MAG TPA: PSD1 and planctomycete cytochrome C domain-containing protein [Vicinamibacterales bacterium]|nr:PSD1 and planctomycete cytochrome C domain-containing protein [Vicinamibacterales bacterium]
MQRSVFSAVAAVWVATLVVIAKAAPQAQPQSSSPAITAEFFETRVRPVLASACLDCHGADASGGLRLDSREAILKGGRSGPAMVPGDPDKSLLVQAVRQTGALKMPKGGKLSAAEVDGLVEWIRGGAPWFTASTTMVPGGSQAPAYVITPQQRAFWSIQPLKTPAVPSPHDATWAKNDIDRFVLARLEQDGLAPVKPADKATLIRRATLDLIGLPPTPDEIDAFEKDSSPDAFAKVVDRLLASPRYGEAWGRMWLDVARYGEDDYRSLDPQGRGFNPYPNAYLYRDWVINAFNDDLPYDQFVKAQLAADLTNSGAGMLPALGFLGLGPWYYDNGAVEITRADERHDRVDVVSRGFLGLTVGCARCHDHKYDPIPQTDYYSLASVFLNTTYREYPQVPKSVADEYLAQDKKIENKEKLLSEFQRVESEQLAQTLALQASKYMQAAWRVTGEPKTEMRKVADEEKLDYELFDRWIKFLAKPPQFYPYLKNWQAMIAKGGSAKEAKSLADEFQALLLDVMFAKKELKEENEIIAAKALPGTKKKEPAKLPSDFVTNDDFCPGCGLELKNLPVERQNLWTDVFSRDLKDGFDPAQTQDVSPGLLTFRGWGLERQLSAERRTYIEQLRADIKKLRADLGPHFPFVHGVADVEKPVELKLARRGNPYNLGDEVPRHFLSILSDGAPQPFSKGSGRLELADAIIRQPIAMRVIVNRVWKGHFGTGIVDSPSNFGAGGERPTHPELLDYLAQWFVDNGRSIKKLHREMMLSATYQLSSESSAKNFDKDSGNWLYWRANRRRMTAEQLRDSLLSTSGAIDLKMAGPSEPLSPTYNRRTVYGKVSRYRLDDYLSLFDFPSPNLSSERRFSTNVPLQRLFLMNSDFMQQQGELLARRTEGEPDSPTRIQKAYKLIYGRSATDAEVTAALTYLRTESAKEYDERKSAAAKTAQDKPPAAKTSESDAEGFGDVAADKMMAGVKPGAGDPEEKKKLLPVTPWGRYFKVLLSANEFVFIS